MEKGIGEIVFRLREEEEITLAQLSRGVCSVSQLGRIERNDLVPDCFLLDYLFGRLGKSTERLEYVLPLEVYELYELRFLVQSSICHRKLEQAEQYLREYEGKKTVDKPWHQQFIKKMWAQIAWIRQESTEKILSLLEEAMSETMVQDDSVRNGDVLNAEELRLMLFRWEVCRNTEYARPPEELKQILEYLGKHSLCTTEKVKVMPYIAILLGMAYGDRREDGILEYVTRESLSLIRETGKLLYVPEILEQYAQVLERNNGCGKFIETLRNERSSLLEVEAEYQISFENFRLFEHTVRRFDLDYELIRSARIAQGITQEELSDGICAQESLARIERGRSPRDKKMYEIMEKLNRKRERVCSAISTEQYETLEIKRKIERCIHHLEYEEAERFLKELEGMLDTNIRENYQDLETERIKVLYQKGELDWRTCIEQLEELLALTLDWEHMEHLSIGLSAAENNILNEIALISYENQEKEKAIQILSRQVQMFRNSRVHPVFHILEWELAMGNLAFALEATEKFSEALEIDREKLPVSMEAGKGNQIGFTLASIAGIQETQNSAECVKYFAWCKDLHRLYNMENLYREVEEYVNNPNFSYKEEVRNYHHSCHCVHF